METETFGPITIIGFSALFYSFSCQQYGGEDQVQDKYNYNKVPPPQIISHKQALNHDGNFKYLFTSENGLAQGESIAPDGSRSGGYSYVDPTGKKISVKYTAGKEGFKILEADHLPKAPQPLAPVPRVGLPVQAAPVKYGAAQDDDQYRPELYSRPHIYPQPYTHGTLAQHRAYQPTSSPITNSIGNVPNQHEYNDEPGKPYSFGNGYVFEFAG